MQAMHYQIYFIFPQWKMKEKFLRVLSTSVIALTKIFLPKMMKNGHGNIMIVSSVAAYAPPSSIQSLYGPVKTFMNRFSESLNAVYNKHKIYSTALCPGYTVTNFHTASGVQNEMGYVPAFLKKSARRIAVEGVEGMLNNKKLWYQLKLEVYCFSFKYCSKKGI